MSGVLQQVILLLTFALIGGGAGYLLCRALHFDKWHQCGREQGMEAMAHVLADFYSDVLLELGLEPDAVEQAVKKVRTQGEIEMLEKLFEK